MSQPLNSTPSNSNSAIRRIEEELSIHPPPPHATADSHSQQTYTPANPFQYDQQPFPPFTSNPRSTTISAPNPLQYQHQPMPHLPRGYNHYFNNSHHPQNQPPPLVNLSQNSNSSASSLASSSQTYSHQPFNQFPQSQGQLLNSLQSRLTSLETNHTQLADQVTTFQQQTQTNHNQILTLLQQQINTTPTQINPNPPPTTPHHPSPTYHPPTPVPSAVPDQIRAVSPPIDPSYTETTRHHELKLPPLTKTSPSDFEDWIIAVKRKIYINPTTRSALTPNMEMHPTMSNVVQIKIYDAIIDAIAPKKASAYIDSNSIILSNATNLLQALHQRHGVKTQNALVQQQTKQSFENIKRGPRESYDKYFDRYLHLKSEASSEKTDT